MHELQTLYAKRIVPPATILGTGRKTAAAASPAEGAEAELILAALPAVPASSHWTAAGRLGRAANWPASRRLARSWHRRRAFAIGGPRGSAPRS